MQISLGACNKPNYNAILVFHCKQSPWRHFNPPPFPTRLPNPFTSSRCWFFQGPPWLSLHTTLHHHTYIQEQVGWEPDYTTIQPPWLSLSQQLPLTRSHSGLLFVVAFLNDCQSCHSVSNVDVLKSCSHCFIFPSHSYELCQKNKSKMKRYSHLRDPFLLSGINPTISIMTVLINSNFIPVRQLHCC